MAQELQLEPLDLEAIEDTPAPVVLDLEPLELEPIEDTPALESGGMEENTGILGMLTDPLWEGPSRAGRAAADAMDAPSLERSPMRARIEGFGAGAVEGIGDLISGLTSPLDLALAATTGGSALAARRGLGTLVKGLNTATRVGSGLVGAQGAERVYNAEDGGDIGQGLLEIAGGIAGGAGRLPSIAAEAMPTPRAQLMLPESTPNNYVGGPTGGRGQVAPANVSPDIAAQIGGLVSDTPAGPRGGMLDTAQLAEQQRLSELGFGQLEQEGISHLSIPDRPQPYTPYQQGDTSLGFAPDGSRINSLYDLAPDRMKPRAVQGATGEAVPAHLKEPIVTREPQGITQGELTPTPLQDIEPEFYVGEGRPSTDAPPSSSAQRYRRTQETAVPTEVVDAMSPQNKLLQALEEAKPLNREQQRIYAQERAVKAARASGVNVTDEASMAAFMSQLKGQHTKVHFDAVRTKLSQTDVDSLLTQVGSSELRPFEKARAFTALQKVLEGEVPQKSEIKLLEGLYGPEFAATLTAKMPAIDRNMGFLAELVNLPRGIMASYDLSAPFRQGIGLVHKKEFWKSFNHMFKSLRSEEGYAAARSSVEASPSFRLAQESKLALTDLLDLSTREEAIMSTWAEKIPGVRASNRAYVSFLNKLRMDTFNDLATNARRMGDDPEVNRVLANQMADFVNTATGRGNLGKLEKHAVLLNSTFFSPRMIASRVKMLNPHYYATTDPMIRKEALKSLFAIASFGGTLVSLGKAAGGSVSLDPTNSDFGKLRIGNTRLDPFGGFQQYIVAASRLLSGKSTSPTTGRTTDLTSGEFGRSTRKDIIQRFGENKLHPAVSLAVTLAEGKDFTGQPTSVTKEMVTRLTPIILQDLYELSQEDPKLIPIAIPPALFGMGSQTFQER